MKRSIQEHEWKTVIILGCGNILFGDDGFGPQAIEFLLKNYEIRKNAEIINAGCSVRNILFDIILSEQKPKKIIIVDAFDKGINPGELFEIDIDDIPENKIDDFSMHQSPTSNLLKELKDLKSIEIKILSCQPKYIPKDVYMGLSKEVVDSIPKVCNLLIKEIERSI